MGLSFLSPMTTVSIETPVSLGVPESVIATGILYSFFSSLLNDTNVDRTLPVGGKVYFITKNLCNV